MSPRPNDERVFEPKSQLPDEGGEIIRGALRSPVRFLRRRERRLDRNLFYFSILRRSPSLWAEVAKWGTPTGYDDWLVASSIQEILSSLWQGYDVRQFVMVYLMRSSELPLAHFEWNG